jgi:hypothetical protein
VAKDNYKLIDVVKVMPATTGGSLEQSDTEL